MIVLNPISVERCVSYETPLSQYLFQLLVHSSTAKPSLERLVEPLNYKVREGCATGSELKMIYTRRAFRAYTKA